MSKLPWYADGRKKAAKKDKDAIPDFLPNELENCWFVRLRRARAEWKRIKAEGGAIMAIDIERWDQDDKKVREIGMSFVRYSNKRGEPSVLRKYFHWMPLENRHLHNGKHVIDNSDNFAFGNKTTEVAWQAVCFAEMHALLEALSATQMLMIFFHGAKSECKVLAADCNTHTDDWCADRGRMTDLRRLVGLESDVPPPPGHGRTVVFDTQDLFTGYIGKRIKGGQARLSEACRLMGVEILPHTEHNAGNDAAYTLALAEQLLTPARPQQQPKSEIDIHSYERMNFTAPVVQDEDDD